MMKRTIKFLHATWAAILLLTTLMLAAAPQTAWADSAFSGGSGTKTAPYQIASTADLDQLATDVNGGNDYSGKYFVLTADITYTHTTAWSDASSTENNYEAIGYYDGTHDCYFKGDFDGAGHTVSGIRIHRSGTDNADSSQGIFGRTSSGANIHSLRLADTRITGYDYTGGIVGDNNGTVTDCHVASNVCIHAVQSYAWYHGGIVGYNYGIVEGCTSAATLTIASDATDCGGYGAIAGSNWYGTLRDNLAIGATVPATTDNYHGAIAGSNYGTLQRNYYTACTVAGVENATGQGCKNADVDGARHAVSIVAADGVTIVPTGTATTYAVSGITIYEGNNGISYGGQFYAGATEQVVLTLTNNATGAPVGYQYGFTASAGTLSGSTLIMPDEDVTISVNTAVLAAIPWAGDGSLSNPYIIEYPSQLDLLAHRVNGTHGETLQSDGYSGKYFRLGADIAYTYTKAWNDAESTEDNFEAIGYYDGSNDRYFRGDFDGAGHTVSGIRIYRSGTDYADSYQGIFGQTGSSATIHSLRLADTRITGYDYTGGIVGDNNGTVTDCHVASNVCIHAVQSYAWNHGGIVGCNRGTVENCTSAATLTIPTGATNCQNYGAIAGSNYGTLRDNLAIGATVPATTDNYHGVIAGHNDGGTLQRNYYTACTVAGVENATGQGCENADADGARHAVSIVAADGVTIVPTGTATTYAVSGITIYEGNNGISYDGQFYAGATEQVELTLSNTATGAPAGYQYDGYTASAGTLSGTTLTMPDEDVTISAALAVIDWATANAGTSDDPYMIYNKDQLDLLAHRVNGTHGQTLHSDGYSGKYFRLGADIAYTYTDDWDVATSTEDNYEAIGSSSYRSFRGDFDGAGHTISGIRIHRSGTATADSYQGIFGRTSSGANIHSLRLADARITGYDNTGGIVGYNDGGTVTDCHVASDVCIHAAQTNAWNHGGIVGYNYGIVEGCTIAATLTIASDATDCENYGAIAGHNDGGTLRDNLAIGATVPAAAYNYHGATVGYNSSNGTLQHNYYTACNVAGVANATNAGCKAADVATNDGAVPALRDNADNSTAIALLAALASTAGGHTPVNLGWGAGQFPLQLAGRTLTKDGNWNTLCLPFGVDGFSGTLLDGATVKELDKDNSNLAADGTLTLTFSTVTSIEAGKPYIVKWEGASGTVADPVFEGVEISETAPVAVEFANISGLDACQFEGQYSPFSIGDTSSDTFDGDLNEIIMLGSGSKLGYSLNARTLNCFRAHFLVPTNGPAGSRAARAFVLDFGDGDNATGIKTIDNLKIDNLQFDTDGWYDLNGRRLQGQPTQKGVYIQNGKKVVIK